MKTAIKNALTMLALAYNPGMARYMSSDEIRALFEDVKE